MSALISPRSFRSLAAGAALVSCSLAAAGGLSPSSKTTINSASGLAYLGNVTVGGSFSGPPSSYLNHALSPVGNGSGGLIGGNYVSYVGYQVDAFYGFAQNSNNSYTSANFDLLFNLTLSETAVFGDLSVNGRALPMSWRANGSLISTGDVLGPGTYTFIGQGTWNDPSSSTNYITFGMALYYGPSAVPLPGAAGLAAVGLVGLRGHRRR
jgi:hypothetical protein